MSDRLTTREAEAQVEETLNAETVNVPKTVTLSSGWQAEVHADGTVTLEGECNEQPMVELSLDDLRAIGMRDMAR